MKVIILGAGITGLSLAWFLKRKYKDNLDLTILEASSKTGGWIQTITQDGFLFENGPHSLRTASPITLQLIEDLGLKDEILYANPAAQKRYLYHKQTLQKVPNSLTSLLFSPLTKGLLRALLNDLTTPSAPPQDETIYSFFSRRLSPQITERLIDTLVSGIYAGDIDTLSIRSCFPDLYNWEKQHGGLLKGYFAQRKKQKHSIFSFRKGMKTLPDALTTHLKEYIHLSTPAKIITTKENKVIVTLENDKTLEADHLYSTLPPHALAPLICIPHLQQHLKEIKSTTLTAIHLGYKEKVLSKEGFGYLIPTQEREDILGAIWDSSIFPEQNEGREITRMTLLMGGECNPDICHCTSEYRINIALQATQEHMGIAQHPEIIRSVDIPFAIPQYAVGHGEKISALKQDLAKHYPQLTCLGTAFHGVSIDNCIATASNVIGT